MKKITKQSLVVWSNRQFTVRTSWVIEKSVTYITFADSKLPKDDQTVCNMPSSDYRWDSISAFLLLKHKLDLIQVKTACKCITLVVNGEAYHMNISPASVLLYGQTCIVSTDGKWAVTVHSNELVVI